jgi:hypothetical protein
MHQLTENPDCRRDAIGAYLDGELHESGVRDFEAHLKTCDSCATELRAQRQLLCTLDAAFSSGIDVPEGFARIVKTRAENDLRGVRHKTERRRAAQLVIMLGLASLALLGSAWSRSIIQPIRSTARAGLSLVDFVWQTVSNAATGLAVIGRLSAQAVVFSPYRFGLLLLFVFLLGIAVVPRLITARSPRPDH